MVDIYKKEILAEVREIIMKVVFAIGCFIFAIMSVASKSYLPGFLWGLCTILWVRCIEISYDIIKINLKILTNWIKSLRETQEQMLDLIKERSEEQSEAGKEIEETKEETNENI